MPIRSICPEEIPEKTSYRYTAVLKNELEVPVGVTDIVTATLTLYALDANLTIINGLNASNCKNAGRGTIDGSGNIAISLVPDDNPVLDQTLVVEKHLMLLQIVYNGGNGAARHEVVLPVRNLQKVP
jgi:hypothetical protein